jgi:dTDP-4-amino-4,6-dideoxygalactose transaminase
MSQLAIFGGAPEVKGPLAPFYTVGPRERGLVDEVLAHGPLSGFYGSWGKEFWGGPMVRRLEDLWKQTFRCRHAVTVNSNTSGLIAAMGAVGIGPGDEVIVPPYTMSASAVAPLFYGGIPVFVDVEDKTFTLDVAQVEKAITPRTKAIMAVNLFGHPAKLRELRSLADRRGLRLVEDNAQGPLAMEFDRPAGTIGHIGVFSLNVHKHVQSGEGGVCVTDDDDLALRLQAIRNHAENVTADLGFADISNLVGFNFRLGEISAAVAIGQIERGGAIVGERTRIAESLTAAVRGLPGIVPPTVREGCRHVYYLWCPRLVAEEIGVPRASLIKALAAEGVPLGGGYVPPLYRLPLFKRGIAIGREGWPFSITGRTYPDHLCPTVERLHERELAVYEVCAFSPTPEQLAQMGAAFAKVWEHRGALANLEAAA